MFFRVTGCGSFPFGLLAACKAWPHDGHEANKISLACPTVAPEQSIWLESHVSPNIKLWVNAKWPITQMQS